MKVTLISHTPNARELLIFTKLTRLTMNPALLADISAWPEERKDRELAYMAETIPSSWEFVDYVFCIEGVSRAYTHQQVRTRAASYAQQSLRILDVGNFDYIYTERNRESKEAKAIIDDVLRSIRHGYAMLRQQGQAPEDARGILPTNIATNIVVKVNLRTLSELVRSRSGGRTQQEYQTVVSAMADAVLAVHPWVERFLFPIDRDHYSDLEAFAEREYAGDLAKKGELLKIVDRMRKENK